MQEVFEPVLSGFRLEIKLHILTKNYPCNRLQTFYRKRKGLLIPLRFIAESFKASVDWYETEQHIKIEISAPFRKKIGLWLNNDIAKIDDTEEIKLDVAPFTIPPGRTVVPLRFIAESFQASVEWFPQDQSIEIVFPKKTSILSLHMVQNWFENSFHNLMNLFNGRG